ncbi:MAG: UDP-N-acetylmuramate dehydrogenase [Gammaproteobacteria bacterium]
MTQSLLDLLPQVEGTYEADVPMANLTWFRVGGPAEVLFKPANEDDLVHFLQNKPDDLSVCVIGVGSNLLVRDGGISGVVIKLSKGFSGYRMDGDVLHAGAATPDMKIALSMQEEGIAGLEFLRGVPGTLGGAVRMNAGAYESEIKDVFVACFAIDMDGERHLFGPDDVKFSYRHSDIPEGWIVTRIALQGRADDPTAIGARMSDIADAREGSQPTRSRTGGSTFKNPDARKAWELIDEAGCRGLKVGDAQVSEQHCNFLINLGGATATDLENLGNEVRRRVKQTSGIDLEWEIRIVGEPVPEREAA